MNMVIKVVCFPFVPKTKVVWGKNWPLPSSPEELFFWAPGEGKMNSLGVPEHTDRARERVSRDGLSSAFFRRDGDAT